MIATREEALEILAPYLETIQTCVDAAVRCYFNKFTAEERTWVSARTRASHIYDAMVQIARVKFADKPGVRMVDRGGQLRIYIEGHFQLRLKKLNHKLRPSNIPTQAVLDFMYQSTFEFADAPPPVTNIIAGYQLDETQTGHEVFIICPVGKSNAWEINVNFELLAQMATPAPSNVFALRDNNERPRRKPAPRERTAGGKDAGDLNEAES